MHCGNGRRSNEVDVRGPVKVLPHCERLMLCSRRAILLMAGSLPSRAVATMSLCGNTSPPLIMHVYGLQLVCLLQVDELRRNVKICHTERSHRRSRVYLAEAPLCLRFCVIVNGGIEPLSTSALWVIPPQHRYPDRPPLMVKGTLFVVTAIRRWKSC